MKQNLPAMLAFANPVLERAKVISNNSKFGDSSRIMKRTIQILISLFLVLQQVTASGAERDILEIVKEHPLNATVNGVPAKYGDPYLAAAVDALGDIPRPWTVPKIIEIFRSESDEWLRKLQAKIDRKSDQMWKGLEPAGKRCGHLATLLASSGDPRAAVVLGSVLDNPQFDNPQFPLTVRGSVIKGLSDYFLRDPRYHQLPKPDGPPRLIMVVDPEISRVKQWWAINKEDLKASTEAQSK
jgi:hypothetical protein